MNTSNTRLFRVFTAPSVADPAWVMSMEELFQDGSYVSYNSFDVIKKAIAQIEVAKGKKC